MKEKLISDSSCLLNFIKSRDESILQIKIKKQDLVEIIDENFIKEINEHFKKKKEEESFTKWNKSIDLTSAISNIVIEKLNKETDPAKKESACVFLNNLSVFIQGGKIGGYSVNSATKKRILETKLWRAVNKATNIESLNNSKEEAGSKISKTILAIFANESITGHDPKKLDQNFETTKMVKTLRKNPNYNKQVITNLVSAINKGNLGELKSNFKFTRPDVYLASEHCNKGLLFTVRCFLEELKELKKVNNNQQGKKVNNLYQQLTEDLELETQKYKKDIEQALGKIVEELNKDHSKAAIPYPDEKALKLIVNSKEVKPTNITQKLQSIFADKKIVSYCFGIGNYKLNTDDMIKKLYEKGNIDKKSDLVASLLESFKVKSPIMSDFEFLRCDEKSGRNEDSNGKGLLFVVKLLAKELEATRKEQKGAKTNSDKLLANKVGSGSGAKEQNIERLLSNINEAIIKGKKPEFPDDSTQQLEKAQNIISRLKLPSAKTSPKDNNLLQKKDKNRE